MSSLSSSTADTFLEPGRCVDSDHPSVQAFAHAHAEPGLPPREIAVRLYYAVRDGFRYDPYLFDMSEQGLRASQVIANGRGFCVPKAALLAASARALGVPARLGFADVRNHLTSPRLRDMMRTDIFAFHGFTELMIDRVWVKATPAFNLSLCEKAGVKPLEFDGKTDSIFHEFDAHGRRHMEYLRDRGSFADVPRKQMLTTFAQLYPAFETWMSNTGDVDFEREVETGDPA